METELTLLICSHTPESVADQICKLTKISGYSLHLKRKLVIRDSYFDTPARVLKSYGWALRLRETEGSYLIAAKGPSRLANSGVVERLELEDTWSPEAFHRILKEIPCTGCNLAFDETLGEMTDPLRAIEGVGFILIQARETTRRIMDVSEPARNERAAELAVDVVQFQFNNVTMIHYEVELESKSETGAEALRSVAGELQELFGSELRIWLHSKLATGWALERLLEDQSFQVPRVNLGPAVYERIEAMLKAEIKSE
ncbi:MAG: CYTH domain-containing protein [Desulfomonile tiedjei]|uniref:CYTH domain-containing protein n=1 Tax=Desulfomonile tiedjei TaxID=2358 RepID=A0A9D6YZS8_9BACT|nr:CYTH domain-containing protein [Desulfomonile tiedjei]